MNIRFMAQSEYFNGIHIKEDIILEKEYEQGAFTNLPKVRYYLYFLEENIRKEIMPHSDKVDIFKIVDCKYDPDYIYFTEYEDITGNGYTFNIIRYNITDRTHTKIISLRDDISLYPLNKQIKIFILDDSRLIIQRALPKTTLDGEYTGFFDFTLILFDFVKNKQMLIKEENLLKNGIDDIVPIAENMCVMKTGFGLLAENRKEHISKEEASVEGLYLINTQQFISDLMLEQPSVVLNAIDQAYFDSTFDGAKYLNGYLIYSKYDFEEQNETVNFYSIESKETFTCINNLNTTQTILNNAVIINDEPYIISNVEDGTQFLNVKTNEVDAIYPDEYQIKFVNNCTIVSTFIEHSFWGKEKEMVTIHKFPSKKHILAEKGEYIGAVLSNNETTYIFLK